MTSAGNITIEEQVDLPTQASVNNHKNAITARFATGLGDFSLDVDLQIPGSGVTAIFGHSGSGKTTLLRCIAGLQKARGKLSVNGEIWQDERRFVPVHQRPLAYVFQEASLFSHLSVRRNLEYGLKRIPQVERLISLDEAVQWLGLQQLIERPPHKLSGGERQRVAIARALLTSPRLLLMDEPLSALDEKRKSEILPYLEQLHDRLQIPVLYVTHAAKEVARLADHLIVMEAGKVLAQGPLTDIMARLDLPMRCEEDAGVVIEATLAENDKRWHLARAEFPGGELWIPDTGITTGKKIRVRVLARDVSIAHEEQQNTSILNRLPATVTATAVDNHPAVQLVRVEVGPTPLVGRMTAKSAHALDLKPGKKIWVQIKTVAVLD